MGGKTSKPVAPGDIKFTPDYSAATVGISELQKQLEAAQDAAREKAKSIVEAGKATTSWWKWFGFALFVIGLLILGVVLYDSLAPDDWPNIFFDRTRSELASAKQQLAAAQQELNALKNSNDTSKQKDTPTPPVAAPPPSIGSRIYNAIFGDSSGDLAPSFHDASTSAVVQGNRAPLSSQDQGGYGMQWWMYVKDWNYGYGKKKSVVKRPDATNSSVLNPHISLHPTDNSLQISVSVFPTTEGGASKSTPAPAGHSGSTDDVFVCEVPNIPLQTWFSVSLTVFGRNLDVYIDGKLVKSCFLSGVPKPAVGDIQLTPEGGFSGRICNFYHYPRMLTPSDALSFWQAGTTCKNKTAAGGGSSAATGYSIKFGVYDSLGKEVQEYAF